MSEHLPGRCHIGADGLLRGPANITHNVPMPTPSGTPGGFGTAFGAVIHTEVGFEHSVVEEFNNPADQASAFFSIGMDGHIHQYGTLGHDWMAWTQEQGNPHYRGVEHEDHGNPSNPLTDAQLDASAQVFEAMSAFDGWPLEATDNPNGGRGIIFHVDGGQAWGGHECPGPVRQAQRGELIRRARAIREGKKPVTKVTADGVKTLFQIAQGMQFGSAHVLRYQASSSRPFSHKLAAYVNQVFAESKVPVPKDVEIEKPSS